MRLRLASILLTISLAAGGAPLVAWRNALARAQDAPALPSPSAIVKPHTYVSLEPVPRGNEFQVAVVAEIARGFHMNSHQPSDKYLIPTTVTPQLPAGIRLIDTIYPPGHLEKFSFSPNKPLDVYTEKVTLKLRLSAEKDAPLGAVTIPITLRYQACNDTTCLQPFKMPIEVKFSVVAAGTKARAVHPEIFSPPAAK